MVPRSAHSALQPDSTRVAFYRATKLTEPSIRMEVAQQALTDFRSPYLGGDMQSRGRAPTCDRQVGRADGRRR